MISLIGCQKDEKTLTIQNTQSVSKNLKIGIIGDVFTLDPGKCADTITQEVLSQSYEGLMQLDEKENVIPNLAERVDISKDEKTYTFHLRKGIRFHNGDELTAYDFKWTFERNLNKKFNSTSAIGVLKNIVGAEAYYEDKAKEIIGVKVLDPYLLEIQTIVPQNYFLYNLTAPPSYALNHKITPKTEITHLKSGFGTGSYILAQHENNKYIKFICYQNYHDQKPQIENLEYFIIEDHTMMLNKVRKGDLDIATISSTDAKIATQEPVLNEGLQSHLTNNIYFLELNYYREPSLHNPKVRLAIAHAINQEELVDEALEGSALAAHYIIPKGMLGYRSGKGTVEFNVHKAKQILQEIKRDPKKIKFDIMVSAKSPLANKVAENVSVQLRKNLGLNVKVHSLSANLHHAKGRKKELTVRFGGSTSDYPDPNCILEPLFSTKSPSNHTYYTNPIFDKLIKKADETKELNERALLYQKAEDIILNDVVVIPLFMPKGFYWIRSKIKNVRSNSNGCLPHNKVIIQE